MGYLLSGMGSGRDLRVGGGQGGGEGLENVEIPAGREPGGDEAVRPHQKPADVAAPRPVGEGRIIAADRQGPPVPRGTVETDKASAECLEDAEIARRHHGRRIDSDAEGEPLMTAEEAIERRSALTR